MHVPFKCKIGTLGVKTYAVIVIFSSLSIKTMAMSLYSDLKCPVSRKNRWQFEWYRQINANIETSNNQISPGGIEI